MGLRATLMITPTQACLRLLRHAEGPMPAPSPVLGRTGYLLQPRVGPQAEVTFLRSFDGDGFQVAGLQGTAIGRMAELVETYLDLPLGIVIFRSESSMPPWRHRRAPWAD